MANGANGDKTQGILQSVGQELKSNPPAIVQKTRQKFGPARALAQNRAILLSKARKQGAQIPGAPGRMVGTR
jgi:hypothetical protein